MSLLFRMQLRKIVHYILNNVERHEANYCKGLSHLCPSSSRFFRLTNKMSVLSHTDLAPCDFILLPMMKIDRMGSRNTVEGIPNTVIKHSRKRTSRWNWEKRLKNAKVNMILFDWCIPGIQRKRKISFLKVMAIEKSNLRYKFS